MKRDPIYLAIGATSFLALSVLERLAAGLSGQLLRTEIYSFHGFSHIFFGIGLASIILFVRPRSTPRLVLLVVLLVGVAWELREGAWFEGEPLDSIEDDSSNPLRVNVSMLHKKREQGTRPMI